MKIRFCRVLAALLFLEQGNSFSQGSFVNLDFEHPATSLPSGGGAVLATNAVPGWTPYVYGIPSDSLIYNGLSLGAASVSLHGPGSHQPIIQGSYTVYLQASTAGTPGSAAIGQVGQIPLGTRSLIFWGFFGQNNVSFNGQILPLIVTATTPNYNIYGADVSAFAGQSGELLFNSPPGFFEALDNIQFSSQPIPEPSTLAFCAVGGLCLFLKRKGAKRLESGKPHDRN